MTNIWIFASGWPRYGEWGSGAKKILEQVVSGQIKVNEITLVSNHIEGWVYKIYQDMLSKILTLGIDIKYLHIPYFPTRWEDGEFSDFDKKIITNICQKIFSENELDYVFLSGYIKHVLWIAVSKLVNIHPGPTQEPYWWVWMHGMKVHEKVWEDYQAWKIERTCVTMHYVTDEVDRGPVICQIPVELNDCNSAKEIARKVNKVEHEWQWQITKMVIEGKIYLDEEGIVYCPKDFPFKSEIDLSASST